MLLGDVGSGSGHIPGALELSMKYLIANIETCETCWLMRRERTRATQFYVRTDCSAMITQYLVFGTCRQHKYDSNTKYVQEIPPEEMVFFEVHGS
jgi:hypothetical protein